MVKVDLSGIPNLLQTYAALKQIPVEKVLRNAAKDYVQGAFKVTPKAEKATSLPDWDLFPGRGRKAGKSVWVRWSRLMASAVSQRRADAIDAYRIRKRVPGFALAAFIPAMQSLGFKQKAPPKSASMALVRRGWSLYASQKDPYQTATGKGKSKTVSSFKRDVEAFRKGEQSKRAEYSTVSQSGSGDGFALEVTVDEKKLSHHPEWSQRAHAAGLALATARLRRDMEKTILNAVKNQRAQCPDNNA